MKQTNISDQAHIFNTTTKNLVTQKNDSYRTSKLSRKPEINLVSVTNDKKFDHLKAKKDQILIVTIHKQKNNVQILVGSNLKKIFSSTTTSNIIRYAGDDLRSSKNKTFNKGIRTVFNACATLIDQHYHLPVDKNTLSSEQLQKVNHPNSVNLVWGIIIAVIVTIIFSWCQKRNKR